MPTFNLTPTWQEIVPGSTTRDQMVQVTLGRALLSYGAPTATSTPIVSGTGENARIVVPAGQSVQARSQGDFAIATTGSH